MSPVRRSIVLSAVERYGNLVLTLLSIVILSRLLTPREFGVFAISSSIVGVMSTVREFGGLNYIVQKQDLSERCIRTAFTVNCAISASLIAALFAMRDPMASFFNEDGLRAALAVSALNFVVLPFAETVLALLRRQMAFDVIAVCSSVATTVMYATSIALAATGYSFMGPVWGLVAGSVVQAILYCVCRRDMRIFVPSLGGWRDTLRFGAYSSGTTMINALNQWSPQLIVGRMLDLSSVGLYARSVNIMVIFDRLVTDVLKPVVLPAIARHGGDRIQLKRFYLHAVELISALQWPFMLVTALLAEPIVAVLFGAAWADAAPLARLLALGSLATFATCLTYPVLVAVGRVRDTLIVNLLSIPPSLLLLYAASLYGVEWVAATALVALPLQAAAAWWYVARYIDIRATEMLKACRKSVCVTVFTVLPVVAVLATQDFSFDVSFPAFVAAGLASVAGWGFGVAVTSHPIWTQVQSIVPAERVRRITRDLRRARPVQAP